MEDALQEAIEAIECHIEGLLIDGEPIPKLQPVEHHQHNPDYADGIWALVTVDLTKLSGKTRRVNITLPERVLALMDKFASEHGETRSGMITQAALEYIASRRSVAEQSRAPNSMQSISTGKVIQ